MLDQPLSCTEVSSVFHELILKLTITHPQSLKKNKIHAAFIIKLTQVFFPSLLSILQIAKTELTILIMLWYKPRQFSYRILLHSVQSKW